MPIDTKIEFSFAYPFEENLREIREHEIFRYGYAEMHARPPQHFVEKRADPESTTSGNAFLLAGYL